MASRPRRSAATKASESISVHAKWADASDKPGRASMASRRSGRAPGSSALRDAPSSPSDSHISVNVEASPKSRQAARAAAARRTDRFDGGQIVTGTRNRGGRKNYVIDSSPDDDDDEEDEAEIDDDDMDDDDLGDEDAEGDEMALDADGGVDAEGDEDAEGDVDMDASVAPPAPTIRVSQPSTSRSRVAAPKMAVEEDEDDEDEDDDDDELSDPGESDLGDQTMGLGDETMADEDAEGEEIEVAAEDDADGNAAAAEPGSDDEGSQDGSPDLAKMTKRQRARFAEAPAEYMKLSDEVQVKKHFTAEELSMRRQEMARRRRNLSEKRTEEVKMETINKLLKKQAPKMSRKGAGRASTPDDDEHRPSPIFVRYVTTKGGSSVSVPREVLSGPAGTVYAQGGRLGPGKMVQEVS